MIAPVTDLLAFIGVSLIVIVTPGQDTALTIRNTMLGGRLDGRLGSRSAGVLTAAGVVTGQLSWAFATSVGLAALLVAWQPGFQALKIAGALYLVYLGIKALRDAMIRNGADRSHLVPKRMTHRTAYRQGVLSNLGNPKMAVFFTSLLPQFAGASPSLVDLLIPGVLFAGLTMLWLTGYAAAVAAAGDVLRRPTVKRVLDGLTGVALVGLGVRVATEHTR
jgi:threonine/homoserine/homoserine lactone efflux protein